VSTNFWLDEVWLLGRLVVALLLGALVGYEREQAAKPAGVRTHSMVSVGAALFAIVSIYGFGGEGDRARVAAQIVSGVGFLGAGLILHQRGSVRGLTTAASLWVTAAIGMAMGVGMIILALGTTLLVYGLLRFGPRTRPPATNQPPDPTAHAGQEEDED
jgi:putative Mg2+ transporter-C (MgtC) family protein